MTSTTHSRRDTLRGFAAAAGFLILGANRAGAVLLPGSYVPRAPFEDGAFSPFAWVEIGPGGVLIRYAAAEMGQGVSTALPQILAEELELEWESVRVAPAPLGAAFIHPRLRERDSAGSRSVRFNYEPLRRVGAAARQMLVQAAAERWDLPVETCAAEAPGRVVHPASGRSLSYADLADAAARLTPPREPRLKDPARFRLIGRSLRRKDVPAKVDGSAVFASDVRLPGLLTATSMQCPRFGGRLAALDEAPARAIPGVRAVLRFDTWFAVVADGFWPAKRGLDALTPRWEGGSDIDSAAISAKLAAAGGSGEATLETRRLGDAAAALAGSERRIEAVYEVPYLAHATMEPMSAVARVAAGGCEIWVGTQRQSVAHDYVATLLGIPRDRVTLHETYLGGGFGRRFEVDYLGQAVLIAQRMEGRPVKLIWTREEDTRQGFYRPATWNRLEGGLDTAGRPVAWTHRIAAQSLLQRIRPYALRPNGLDVAAVEGAVNHPYAIPNQRVEWSRVDLPVPVGAWRSVGSSQNAFVTECFIDELAQLAGADPYRYRRDLMTGHPRHRAVLDLAAERAGWGTPLPAGHGRGVAAAECFGGWCAQVAEVEAVPGGRIRVRRMVAVLDCGLAVNPSIVEAQVESAIVFGLSAALFGQITVAGGAVQQTNFDDHPILRIDEMPRIEVHILPSHEAPGGVGEIATPQVAPAVANAIFAATGRRIRSLPLALHGVV
ncbi:xanthine dehydrogenase family protein molybdopterin-binding subunit [Falsiroseomonas selenitidurans]|uniref:Xanthine dehydrogenase family protein molybdopterin-binding subunit n=1 Tax=Falsiroseomonas selenitidurans TaxID=2716335 RepID=A0ABX1EAM5_9PROT|nr:xanthine dehydrogenase family protein molybdopterin-binding subunit [Falsiroseomonas selenitidurans]NKC33885.1 xanthine dehydrogenase family protein molybdopterin-binding subunit [Falsiroseomonas selenitidurans]